MSGTKSLYGQLYDVTAPEVLEIELKEDGTIFWANTEDGCVFRTCRIKQLVIGPALRKQVLNYINKYGME